MSRISKNWVVSFMVDCMGYDPEEAGEIYTAHGGEVSSFMSQSEYRLLLDYMN